MGKFAWRTCSAFIGFVAALAIGCNGGSGNADAGIETMDGAVAPDPAALVQVHVTGVVGVLLTEVPDGRLRDRVVEEVLGQSEEFWIERVRTLLSLTEGRLMSRTPESETGDASRPLPLPPRKQWTFEILDPERMEVEGHDVVGVGYKMEGYLLTDLDSVGVAEPALAEIGGSHVEGFTLPVDPEHLFTRTGFACVHEPPGDVRWDDYTVLAHFDDRCRAAEGGPVDCHRTGTAQVSCAEAIRRDVGSMPTEVWFERIPWDETLATEVRSSLRTPESGADLAMLEDSLGRQRVETRYFEPDSCAVLSGCVGGPGWRKLLRFDAEVFNAGGSVIEVGSPGSPNVDAQNIFVDDACHGHPHHVFFADVRLGGEPAIVSDLGRSECLTSRVRPVNHETSPLTHDFTDCSTPGLAAGWGLGTRNTLDCQWLDITNVDPTETTLSFDLNPASILCEGLSELDDSGQLSFEPSGRTNELGEPVGQPLCSFRTSYESNNAISAPAIVPPPGEGLITEPCGTGAPSVLQDCGFALQPESPSCTPGELLRLSCVAEDASARPRVLRLCEYSQALGSAIPCGAQDAMRNMILDDDEPIEVTLRCPESRGAGEPGGRFAIYERMLFERDAEAFRPMECVTAAGGR